MVYVRSPSCLIYNKKIWDFLVGKHRILIEVFQINSSGYAETIISNSEVVKDLKQSSIDHSLPTLSRKWDKIDMDYVSRVTTSRLTREKVSELISKGISNKEIIQRVGISKSTFYKIKRNVKNKQ